MNLISKDTYGCPFLLLAPMEGLGDLPFRKAMVAIGGFDQACTEFLRVPTNAHIPSLVKQYVACDTTPIPQAAQIMGSDPNLMGEMTFALAARGAPRVDLNCGCPSNTVTGRGAGSSLLKDPNHLYKIAKTMVDAVEIPVTAKLRTGFDDTSLFKENLLAAQESGIKFLTLHARTKTDGYTNPARWEMIAEAKQLLRIPVIGNGDILTVEDAIRMLEMTQCDGLMIGRGSVINPFIFREIRSYYSKVPFDKSWDEMLKFFHTFISHIPVGMPMRNRISKLKQLAGFLFKGNDKLLEKRNSVLTTSYVDANDFLARVLPLLQHCGGY